MSESNIKFKLNKSRTEIYACYSLHKPNLLEIDLGWVTKQLKEKGLSDYILLKNKVTELVRIVTQTEEGSGKIRIAGSKDAKVNIEIIDEMSACMSITPPKGGRQVSLNTVKKALADKGIRHGFLLDEIRISIVSGNAEKTMIAKATPPINGKDAKFICTLPEVKIRTKKSSDRGKTNTKEPADFTVIEKGEAVMQRIPATDGISSKNIFGEILKAIPGEDTPFSANLKGVSISDDDPNMLIATDSGQPIIVKNGICIEKTMSVNKVNLSTGNVIFEGSVIVTGDVENGMIVHARKDITVKGMVSNAILDAGGNILVRGAVIGREDKKSSSNISLLKANGHITAKFLENTSIESNSNIYIQDWVLKSDLTARNEIVVGSSNSSKGQITGGRITAGLLIKAVKLGSSAGVETYVEAGMSPEASIDMKPATADNIKQEKVLQEINKKIETLKSDSSKRGHALLEEAKHAYSAVEKSIIKFRKKQKMIDIEKSRLDDAKVVITKMVYAGVTVEISGKKTEFTGDAGKRTLTIKGRKLAHSFD